MRDTVLENVAANLAAVSPADPPPITKMSRWMTGIEEVGAVVSICCGVDEEDGNAVEDRRHRQHSNDGMEEGVNAMIDGNGESHKKRRAAKKMLLKMARGVWRGDIMILSSDVYFKKLSSPDW
mmetsp:Transcript_23078/g.48654  ORF Transcript_23078/g.48654 Transcript_23078/m.48654 type:complete len:123 (-) Transcript_23078:163-531(-)